MSIKMDVPLGEFVDRLTILEIKSERLTDPEKLKNNNHHLENLRGTWQQSDYADADISSHFAALKAINEKLWEIEDDIREKEANGSFDDEFIDLARAVYLNNDERARIKNEINKQFKSEFTEEKSYTEYRRDQA
jgi:hypothetical protein